MTLYLFSHNPGSQGGKALAEELDIRRLKHEGKHILNDSDVVINWGSSSPLPRRTQRARVLNTPEAIALVVNKLAFFEKMNGVKVNDDNRITPKHFTTKKDAADFLARNGGSMVCRTLLNGSGGRGIVIADSAEQLVEAKLYTRYIQKKKEFRIHVFNGKIIDEAEKARRLDHPNPDWRVRSYDNGFIFKRDGITVPKSVRDVAIKCMGETSLLFGALDIIWSERTNRAYVLEINSAPGIEGTTVINYSKAFKEYL